MQQLVDELARSDDGFAQLLGPLLAVVVALVGQDGRLLQANRGCRHLLDAFDDSQRLAEDMRSFFVHPSFAQLINTEPEEGRPVYEGIINIGDINTFCRSLVGVVHRRGGQLLLVAEYDVVEMERLNAQVLELNEDLASVQRDLSRSNRKLQESEARLMTVSLTDPLTGLANRRRLMEYLKNEIERSSRYKEPFSMIMTDIDFFKKVNDEFGHGVGDEVLLEFSNLLKDQVRSVDLVVRLGGEEFIIVMPNTSLVGALSKAELLRAKTENMYFDSMQRGVTASFGVAEFLDTDDANSLLKRVDEAVYTSKHLGRNRVTAHDLAIPR